MGCPGGTAWDRGKTPKREDDDKHGQRQCRWGAVGDLVAERTKTTPAGQLLPRASQLENLLRNAMDEAIGEQRQPSAWVTQLTGRLFLLVLDSRFHCVGEEILHLARGGEKQVNVCGFGAAPGDAYIKNQNRSPASRSRGPNGQSPLERHGTGDSEPERTTGVGHETPIYDGHCITPLNCLFQSVREDCMIGSLALRGVLAIVILARPARISMKIIQPPGYSLTPGGQVEKLLANAIVWATEPPKVPPAWEFSEGRISSQMQ